MNHYYLFGGDEFYPEGGFHDFKGRFISLEEAKEEAIKVMLDKQTGYGWCHIVFKGKIIEEANVDIINYDKIYWSKPSEDK